MPKKKRRFKNGDIVIVESLIATGSNSSNSTMKEMVGAEYEIERVVQYVPLVVQRRYPGNTYSFLGSLDPFDLRMAIDVTGELQDL
jgi:hypothetical protein